MVRQVRRYCPVCAAGVGAMWLSVCERGTAEGCMDLPIGAVARIRSLRREDFLAERMASLGS